MTLLMGKSINPEFKFLFVTAALVLITSAHTFYSLTQPLGGTAVEAESAEAFKASTRSPASISALAATTEHAVLTSQVLEWECGQNILPVSVSGSQLRIKGKNKKALCNTAEIKNATNGFTASVFQTSNEAFTTDFIDLADGDNTIQITTRDTAGKKVSYELRVRKAHN